MWVPRQGSLYDAGRGPILVLEVTPRRHEGFFGISWMARVLHDGQVKEVLCVEGAWTYLARAKFTFERI